MSTTGETVIFQLLSTDCCNKQKIAILMVSWSHTRDQVRDWSVIQFCWKINYELESLGRVSRGWQALTRELRPLLRNVYSLMHRIYPHSLDWTVTWGPVDLTCRPPAKLSALQGGWLFGYLALISCLSGTKSWYLISLISYFQESALLFPLWTAFSFFVPFIVLLSVLQQHVIIS